MKKILKISIAALLLTAVIAPTFVLAQEVPPAAAGGTKEKIESLFDPGASEGIGGIDLKHIGTKENKGLPKDPDLENFSGFYSSIAKIMMAVSTVGVFIALIVAGTMLALGQTNEQVTETAKKIITYTLVGVGIIIVAYSVIFGITQLDPFG